MKPFKIIMKKHKKTIAFFSSSKNCVTTPQYEEYILQPEVSTTPGKGCFAMTQTDGHRKSMTELAQWPDAVQILSCILDFFKGLYVFLLNNGTY